MNPGIVSAAVVVVGAIAAALYYVFNEQPQAHSYSHRHGETVNNNINFNTFSTNNYYGSDKSSGTENESRNRKKPRNKVTMKNDKCGICLEQLVGEIDVLACEHAYHTKCLEDYAESERNSNQGNLRCPLCRRSID